MVVLRLVPEVIPVFRENLREVGEVAVDDDIFRVRRLRGAREIEGFLFPIAVIDDRHLVVLDLQGPVNPNRDSVGRKETGEEVRLP